MSRKVTLRVPVDLVVRDRDVRMLAIVERRSQSEKGAKAGKGWAALPIRMLASDLHTSQDTARRALASCVAEGYLATRENFASNGCQLENFYSLTAAGRDVLAAAREAGLVE